MTEVSSITPGLAQKTLSKRAHPKNNTKKTVKYQHKVGFMGFSKEKIRNKNIFSFTKNLEDRLWLHSCNLNKYCLYKQSSNPL